jgi:polar amino acid transport system substrate-binding protein
LNQTKTAATLAGVLFLATLTACGQSGAGQASGTQGAADASEQKVASVAELLPKNVAESGILKVGTSSGGAPPEGFTTADGKLEGYEIEIIEAAAATAGLRVDWQKTDFAALIPGLNANRFSMAVAQIGVTAERSKVVDFVPIAQMNNSFAARKDLGLKNITRETLCGKSLAVTQGSTMVEYGTAQSRTCEAEGKPAIKLEVFQSGSDAWLATKSGRTEIYWSGSTDVGYLVKQTSDVEIVGEDGKRSPTGIALDKGSPLGPVVAAAFQHLIDDGSYQKILDKWGLDASTAVSKGELNPEITE